MRLGGGPRSPPLRRSLLRTGIAGAWLSAIVLGLALALNGERTGLSVAMWAAALATAEQVRVPTPSGGRISLIAGVGLIGVVLVDDLASLAAMYLLGLAGAAVLALVNPFRDHLSLADGLRETLGLATLLVVEVGDTWVREAFGWVGELEQLNVVLAAGVAWFVADSSARIIRSLGVERSSVRYVWLLALEDWPVVVTLFASAGLFALTQPVMGWWALLVSGVPYAISHIAFSLLARARRTYGQMMRALSKLPEVAGLTPDGHAEGTATLAVQIGRRLGLHPDDVVELEYAALLHDIGRIVAEAPDEDSDERDLARWGAEIIRQAPYLTHVAEQVEAHPMPYRRPGEERDPDLSVNARIVRVASQYDEASRSHELLPLEALEVLYRRTAYDFDPVVVASLREVLTARGELP